MKVLVKPAGCPACVIHVDNTLEAFPQLIGGYIEVVTPRNESGWCVVCDEEGRIKRRIQNCKIGGIDFVGKIAIVGVKDDDFTDITPEQIKDIKAEYPQLWGY